MGPVTRTEMSRQPEMLPPASWGRAHGDPHRLEAGVVREADTRTVLLLSVRRLGGLGEFGGRCPSTLGFRLIHAQSVPYLGLMLQQDMCVKISALLLPWACPAHLCRALRIHDRQENMARNQRQGSAQAGGVF